MPRTSIVDTSILVLASAAASAGLALRAGAAEGRGLRAPIRIALPAPVCATTGDFDGDGLTDIAVVSATSRITVLLAERGRPDSFRPLPASLRGENSFFVRADDFDEDGLDDLTVADIARSAYFLRSIGGGVFAPAAPFREAVGPRWTAHADLDRDGKLDVITANYHTSGISVYLGDGAGAFAHRGTLRLDQGPHCLEPADLDGDGRLDLIAGLPNTGFLALLGREGGGFQPGSVMPDLGVGAAGRYVAVGDVDGDGMSEAATAKGLVVASLGSGSPRTILDAILPGGVVSPVIADLDGDGALDAAFVDDRGVHAFRGTGDGRFGPGLDLEIPRRFPYFAHAGDLDGDLRADLVIADIDDGAVTIIRGAAGEGLFEVPLGVPTPEGGAADLALADLDGDGTLDLFAAARGAPSVHVAGAAVPLPIVADRIAVGDLDSDGIPDVVGLASSSGDVAGALLDRDATVRGRFRLRTGSPAGRPLLGRAVGDAALDLVIPVEGSDRVVVFPGIGAGGFGAPIEVPTLARPVAVSVADLDRDGLPDLAVAGAGAVAVHRGSAAGAFSGAEAIDLEPGASYPDVAAADLNLDGDIDLVVADPGRESLIVLEGTGAGGLAPVPSVPAGLAARRLVLADLDGDRRLDLIASAPEVRGPAVLHGADGPTFETPALRPCGSPTQAHLAGDVDGDGAIDVVVLGSGGIELLRGVVRRGIVATLRRGDASPDGRVAIDDGIAVLDALFRGGGHLACEDAADADDDGRVSITDAILVLRWLFLGGDPPAPPGPSACGEDPTADELAPCRSACPAGPERTGRR